jgi:hypothetical protein
MHRPMEKVFAAIPSVINSLETNGPVSEAVIFGAWENCAGELLSARTSPLAYQSGRLSVAVEDETWRRHLEELSPQMVARINTLAGRGSLRFIDFIVDAKTVAKPKAARQTKLKKEIKPPPAPESVSEAAGLITDEVLRQKFIDAAETCISRRRP